MKKAQKSDSTNGMAKKKASEKRMAYMLVAPSLILILVISVWPVLQSFYFSLFDLKLNSPTKSETHLSYSFDLERYLDNFPFLVGAIDNEMRNGNAKLELTEVKSELQALDTKLQKDSTIQKNYDVINEKLLNMEEISPEQGILKIDKKTAKEIQKTTQEINDELKTISKNTTLAQEKKVVGLSSAINQVVVEPTFIGLEHYKENLTDKRMWRALGNTMTFTIISVSLELILGLAIALLINKAFIGRGLIRATILIPWAIPTAVSALMWKYLYDGQNGIVAMLFEKFGLLDSMSNLLTTQAGAMFSVIFSDVWKTTPYMSLLLLAGLQTIPGSLYEAASIDGATKWKQFTSITMPLIKSSLLVALLFRTLDAFRVFDLIFVLTGGGPANSTETISIMAYKSMFSQTNFGDGSALSVIVFICVAIISMIYIKFLGKDLLGDHSKK